jgi:hypothetical protein
MNDSHEHTERNEASEAVGELLRALRNGRGECPNLEALAARARGDLAERDSAAIDLHIARCGRCDLALEQLREGKAREPRLEEGPLPSELSAAEGELGRRMQTFLGGQHPIHAPHANRVRASWLWSCLRSPALGWVFAIFLVVPTYRYFSGRGHVDHALPIVSSSAPNIGSAREIVIPEVRRGVDNRPASAIRLGAANETLVLTLFAPVRHGFRYSARIDTMTGSEVLQPAEVVSFDGLGNFHIVIPPGVFKPGAFTLTIAEDGNARGPWQFPLEFVKE